MKAIQRIPAFFHWQLALLMGLLLGRQLMAQTDTLSLEEETGIDQAIEDLILNAEVEEQVDYSELTDYLESLRRRPLNLNTAGAEELRLLPGMNDLMIYNLQRHIEQFGKLTSVYELQAVKGFTPAAIEQFLPYVTCNESRLKDISPGTLHPAGPPPEEVLQGLEGELISRLVWVLEEQKGYTAADTTFRPILNDAGEPVGQDTLLSTRYAGSPYRSYTRLRVRYNPNFSFALTGEKDPGEAFSWKPRQRQYGYDFLSGHLAIQGYGNIKNLVIGDYTLQFGQGIALSRGLGFGKGAAVINSVKMPAYGIRPYASVNENQYMRGVAGTFALGQLYFTGFFSKVQLDASVQQRDTLTEEVELVSSIQTSGLHRTPSELANRRAIGESLAGGRLAYQNRSLTIGTTFYLQQFDSEINRPLNAYNQFDFRGSQNELLALDVDWVFQNFNFFGEVARSKSGGIGLAAGVMSSLAPTVDVALHLRHFSKDFHSSRGYVFAERPTTLQNESGLYLGLSIHPTPQWTISSYFDQFYFAWNRFRASYPSRGYEAMVQLEYKPKRGTQIYVRYRSDNKEQDAGELPPGQKLDFLVPTNKQQARLHVQTKIGRDILVRNRMEFSWYRKGTEKNSRGFLIYQDLIYKFGFKLRLTARYALFDAPAYDARIYAYENDVLGFFSIPPYYRTGSRYYLILNWKVSRSLECWLRFAQSRFRDLDEIGSGLESISGNTRSELKFQLRIKM